MSSFYFETFGCQMNVADSALVTDALIARGYIPADSAINATILIVNTCSVRDNAESRARMRLSQYAALKRTSEIPKKLWVIGCMAERLGNVLKKEIRGIDEVIGATRLEFIEQFIDGMLPLADTKQPISVKLEKGPSVFVPIMRGCDNFCTYCIVPFVRGREHSINADEIESGIRTLVENGVREVTLLGQNVNSYRDGETSFPSLLKRIQKQEGLKRIRFMTPHPKDCSIELLDTIAESSIIAKHIHLPVQAGSNRVLSAMNRGYTIESYLTLINAIRSRMSTADITTDVMVGFPSETSGEFLETMALFREVKYTQAFMFAYSSRQGTAAADMPDSLSEEEKKSRLADLIEVQTAITKEKYNECVGQTQQVLVTCRQDAKEGLWMGQNNGCKKTLCVGENIEAGELIDVKVVRSSGMTLRCERIAV